MFKFLFFIFALFISHFSQASSAIEINIDCIAAVKTYSEQGVFNGWGERGRILLEKGGENKSSIDIDGYEVKVILDKECPLGKCKNEYSMLASIKKNQNVVSTIIFNIDGTKTVNNAWGKRILLLDHFTFSSIDPKVLTESLNLDCKIKKSLK